MPNVTTTYNTTTVTYDQSSLSYDGFDAPLSNMPAVGVFIAWSGNPYEFVPTGGWTEISQYVRSINIRRGRQDDLQQFPPGTASLVLDNRDRLFDPFNTAGANYANLKPRKQIKIVANWNGVEYPLYRGYVAGWPVEYTEAGLDSTVTIDCFDLLGLIAATDGPTEWAQTFIALNPPFNYYKCDENIVSQNTDFSSVTISPAIKDYGTDAFDLNELTGKGRSGGVDAPGLLGKGFDATNGTLAAKPNRDNTVIPFADFTLSAWVSAGDISSTQSIISLNGIRVVVEFRPTIRITVDSGSGASDTKEVNYNRYRIDPNTHHIMVTFSLTTRAINVYWDGVLITPSTTTTSVGSVWTAKGFSVNNIAVQQIMTWQRVLSATDAYLLFQFGIGQLRESFEQRVNRIWEQSGLSTSFISNQMSSTVQASQLNNKQTIVNDLQIAADSQDGDVFTLDTGLLTIIDQRYLFNQSRTTVSQMVFTDSGTGIKYDADRIQFDLDADKVRNSITVSFTGGGAYEIADATSIAINGNAAEVLQTVISDAGDAKALGDSRLAIYKNPKLRLQPFMAKGQQDPSYNWPRLLGLELLDRVTFKRTPAVGSAVQRDLLVQSIEHRITPGEWQTVVNGSTRYTGWFILGVSLLGSSEDVLL